METFFCCIHCATSQHLGGSYTSLYYICNMLDWLSDMLLICMYVVDVVDENAILHPLNRRERIDYLYYCYVVIEMCMSKNYWKTRKNGIEIKTRNRFFWHYRKT